MRPVRVLAGASADTADRPWFPGLPHAMAGIATYFVFGAPACVTGLLLATLAGFVVYLPVTALALNGGRAYRGGRTGAGTVEADATVAVGALDADRVAGGRLGGRRGLKYLIAAL